MTLIGNAARATVEGFSSLQDSKSKRDAYVELTTAVLTFVVALVLLGFIGKYLWNSVITDLFSFAKPARSFWQVIGLMIFIGLMRGA